MASQDGRSDEVKTMVGFIWGVAELLRGRFQPREYQDITLPMTVLRRFDTIIEAKQDEVRVTNEKFKATIDDRDLLLRKVAGAAFYNTSKFNLL